MRYKIATNIGDIIYDTLTHSFNKEIITPTGSSNSTIGTRIRLSLGKKCNFNCTYCSQHMSTTFDTDNDIDILKLVLNILNNRDVFSVFFWGGEPLLYFDKLVKIFNTFSKFKKDIHYLVITNGSLLNNTITEFFLKNNIQVFVSYDGNSNMSYRSKDILGEKVEFLRKLNAKSLLRFNCVCTNKMHSLSQYITYVQNILQQEICINEFRANFIFDQLSADCVIPLHNYGESLYKDLLQCTPNQAHFTKESYDYFVSTLNTQQKLHSKCIVLDDNVLCVNTQGDIVTCHNFNSTDLTEFGEPHLLGNIRSNLCIIPTLKNSNNMKKCSQCLVNRICRGGCLYTPLKYEDINCRVNYEQYLGYFKYFVSKLFNCYVKDISCI